jgi:voltage-gated potassium channel
MMRVSWHGVHLTERECARLPCVPLVLRRGEDVQLMPELATRVQSGDELLFCGRERTVHLLVATLANEYTLRYLMTGTEPAHGYFMRWLLARKNPQQHNRPTG